MKCKFCDNPAKFSIYLFITDFTKKWVQVCDQCDKTIAMEHHRLQKLHLDKTWTDPKVEEYLKQKFIYAKGVTGSLPVSRNHCQNAVVNAKHHTGISLERMVNDYRNKAR